MAAAAAAAAGPSDSSKKRKHDGSEPQHESLSLQSLAESAAGRVKRLAAEINATIQKHGGIPSTEVNPDQEPIQLNVGGQVMAIPARSFLHPFMRPTYIATLLLQFRSRLPRDKDGRAYLEASPDYMRWLGNKLALLESQSSAKIQEELREERDEYHELFMQRLGERGAEAKVKVEGGEAMGMGGRGGEVELSVEGQVDKMLRLLGRRNAAVEALESVKTRLADFLETMRPFMRPMHLDSTEIEIWSLEVMGQEVAITSRTLSHLGPDRTLAERFSPNHPAGRTVLQTSAEHFSKIVDYARRVAVMPSRIKVHRPVVIPSEQEAFQHLFQLYGMEGIGLMYQIFVTSGNFAGFGATTITVNEHMTVEKVKTIVYSKWGIMARYLRNRIYQPLVHWEGGREPNHWPRDDLRLHMWENDGAWMSAANEMCYVSEPEPDTTVRRGSGGRFFSHRICYHRRSFMHHAVSADLDDAVAHFLGDVRKLECRSRLTDLPPSRPSTPTSEGASSSASASAAAVSARDRRVALTGLREVSRALAMGRLKVILVAPNIEEITSLGGLEDRVKCLMMGAAKKEVPVIFALSRAQLGRALGKNMRVSLVGVQSIHRCADTYKQMIDTWLQHK
ncbi:unnamed protein product [Vitrella brassicaformis CCMP3155]|uniref:Ribosomal protein eL8/eL30/eS12/Gadd45 domain-containing protein n=1 Tax=Vitrella brassicaformis (strain CCMP3155) TaxID=1169540 RepID=A0A0G4EEZ2_VITBC|nr:unnamed protein product [Vitrella brassicaformis CCMP3155]|eukprot:CEL93956.1 unnamed protein product [Vitrella brassicaformis CCMP3155]